MNGHKYDAITNTLMVSRAFEKHAKNPNTTEYALYYKFRADIPDAGIIVDGKNKGQRDVSTKEMESYIRRCNNTAARLNEFNRQKILSKVQRNPVKYMQNWFHENYANYSDCPEYNDGFVVVKTKAQMEAATAVARVSEQQRNVLNNQNAESSEQNVSTVSDISNLKNIA